MIAHIQPPTRLPSFAYRVMSARHCVRLALGVLFLPLAAALVRAQYAHRYRDATLPIDVRVHDLPTRMTLEEKFWQLFMIPGDLDDSTRGST